MKDMLKKFNTTETWIDVETLANLKGISKRAIRLSFNSKNSNYETKIENGKGGKLYKIRLSSIEEGVIKMENSVLDDKINKVFAGCVVRKDLVKTVKGNDFFCFWFKLV